MQYRIAVLGCGHIGRKHAALAARYGKLVGVADTDQEKATAVAQLYQVSAYSNLTELLAQAEPEIVVICTPNGIHAEHSLEALRSNAHVLCEKPMALNSKDAAEMIQTARLFNKRLFVVKQNRFNPPVAWVKQLLEQQQLGNLVGFQLNAFWNRDPAYFRQSAWRGSLNLDGGPLFTQFSHFVDLLYWYLGPLKEVKFATAENRLHPDCIEFEDQGMVVLEFECGISGSVQYSLNAHKRNMEGSITLFGEKGTVKIGGSYLNEIAYCNIEGVEVPTFPVLESNQYGTYEGSSSQHHLVYEAMLKTLENPANRFLGPEEALQSVAIIETIYAKMGNRRKEHE
jgi:UDP-N-acetyl-2-amino-2-deoxyglucuronate dehydrogenase